MSGPIVIDSATSSALVTRVHVTAVVVDNVSVVRAANELVVVIRVGGVTKVDDCRRHHAEALADVESAFVVDGARGAAIELRAMTGAVAASSGAVLGRIQAHSQSVVEAALELCLVVGLWEGCLVSRLLAGWDFVLGSVDAVEDLGLVAGPLLHD